MTDCMGRHNLNNPRIRVVSESGEFQLCRRHWNRLIEDWAVNISVSEIAERCPTHPEQRHGITRWYGDIRLHCTKPLEHSAYSASGRGVFRRPAGMAVTRYCDWQRIVSPGTIDRNKMRVQDAVARLTSRESMRTALAALGAGE